jgi:protein gp37
MSVTTNIEWCDSTVNPTMGCDGCELWSKTEKKCYAGTLHERYGGSNIGFAPTFEQVTLFPGRMAKAAKWSDLSGTDRADKPWLSGLPRHIFVSDMSDALSKVVTFEYLKTEIIDNVTSDAGRRHVWMWLTKRPSRMVEFCVWLYERGISWPINLMPGTSLTTQSTESRITEILDVSPARRFLSVEPLIEPIDLGFNRAPKRMLGISLVIVGGESGPGARPCDLAWVRSIRDQCAEADVCCFVKQLGSRYFADYTTPEEDVLLPNGKIATLGGHRTLIGIRGGTAVVSVGDSVRKLKLSPPKNGEPPAPLFGFKGKRANRDSKGGDMDEWPPDLRVRQFPKPQAAASQESTAS